MNLKRFLTAMIAVTALCTSFACTALQPQHNSKVNALAAQIADLNERVDGLQRHLDAVQATSDRHETALLALRHSIAEQASQQKAPPSEPAAAPADVPAASHPSAKSAAAKRPSPESLYQTGLKAYRNGRYAQAKARFERFVRLYPNHDLADNALYWHAECLYATKEYAAAIAAFETVHQTYPQSGKAPDALLKIGYAYSALENPTQARMFLKKVLENYPFSPAAAKAEKKLKALRF